MKLNTNKNSYIIIYSIIIVVIVAFLLAFVSQALKPMQEANVALDVKKQILNALNIRGLSNSQTEAKYKEVVVDEQTVDDEIVYTCNVEGETKYVFHVKGMGLWGPIYGYISVNEDKNTVYGSYFTHDSETAGLGAEIKDSRTWQEKFQGKKLFKDGVDGIALGVKKKVQDAEVEVDAITGATLTSDGVDRMLKDTKSGLGKYVEFLSGK